MEENQSRKWSESGLKFCQFSKNSAYHAGYYYTGIKQSLYEAMFGKKKVSFGLKMLFLPNDIINNVNDYKYYNL
jgi:hypothetical protein